MNDTQLINLLKEYQNDHFDDLIVNMIDAEIYKMIKQSKPLIEIVKYISSIYDRFHDRHNNVDMIILSKLYNYILEKYPTVFEEQFQILLTLYNGSKEDFLNEYSSD